MGGLEGSNVQDVIDHYLMAMKAIMRMDQLSGEEMEGILDKTFKSIHDIGKDTTEGMQITFNDDLIDKILQDLQECLMHKFSLDIQMRILITMKDMLTDLTKNDLSIDQGMMMLRKLKNTLKFDI
uniref:Anti-sigma factor n=1 Tax=Rhabditophanes sp. KR3021 TaxID=114890 RepID=A0AC35TWS0_9BILA